jgi:hypothetical protein
MYLPAMIGLATEKVNRLYYKYKTGRTVYDPRPTGGVQVDYDVVGEDSLGIKLRSKSFKWMVGHLDGLVTEADKWGVFESKHTGAVSEWNPPEAVVERNFWQGAHYCLLTGLPWIDFSCLYGLQEWQTFRVTPSEDQLTLLLGRLNRFAKHLADDTPPDGAESSSPDPSSIPSAPMARPSCGPGRSPTPGPRLPARSSTPGPRPSCTRRRWPSSSCSSCPSTPRSSRASASPSASPRTAPSGCAC